MLDHPALALSPDAIERLSQVAVELFSARDFDAAKGALELLEHAGALSIPLRFSYAVCLTEVGAEDHARQIWARALASTQALAVDDPRRPILETLAESMSPWIAGGAQARSARDGLKSSAEKWMPKLGR